MLNNTSQQWHHIDVFLLLSVFWHWDAHYWGQKVLDNIGRADFKIEITIICVLRLSVTLRQNGKKINHCFSGGVIKLDPSYTRPHVLETQEHSSKESCCLSYGLNFIILMQSSKSMPGSRHCCQVFLFIFFIFSPKTCSDFTWSKALSNQPDIIRLRLSASLLPGRRNAALGGWMSTAADWKWRSKLVTVLPAQCNTHTHTHTWLRRPVTHLRRMTQQLIFLPKSTINFHLHWKCKCQ